MLYIKLKGYQVIHKIAIKNFLKERLARLCILHKIESLYRLEGCSVVYRHQYGAFATMTSHYTLNKIEV